jgi:hypothetical protein
LESIAVPRLQLAIVGQRMGRHLVEGKVGDLDPDLVRPGPEQVVIDNYRRR